MLRASETLAVNLAEISTDFAYAAVRVQEEGAEVVYQLKVRIEGKKKKLRIEGGVPVLSVRVRALAQVIDAARPAGLVEVAESAIVPRACAARAAEEQYRAAFLSAAERAHAAGCDLFSLHEKLRRRFPPPKAGARRAAFRKGAHRLRRPLRYPALTAALKPCADMLRYPALTCFKSCAAMLQAPVIKVW